MLFLIGTLNTGGAERQLSVLAKGLSGRGHKVRVVTLFPGGKVADDLGQGHRVELISLWPYKSRFIIVRLFQLAAAPLILRRLIGSADCLYSMLEVTNFIAWLATRFKRNAFLTWGVRSANMEGHWKMALFDKLCALVSPSIKLLIANSHAGLECLLKRGYHPHKHTVISNGIDTSRFQYNEESRRKIRHELGVSVNQPLVGTVARLNPMKDHPTFLKAAALVMEKRADVRFVCAGGGVGRYADELHALAYELGLKGRVLWLGDRSDVVDIYSGLDVLVSSSSFGEGFPNVVGEAMSCGVPCVVTDVGDSARIVGETGRVVPAGDVSCLALEILAVLDQLAHGVTSNGLMRKRIEEKYSVKNLLDQTEHLFNEVMW